ncbi:hypothetical protein CFOL_v3_32493 [Cephalotus follicularis]|uniref:Uncharacterized protein n=1 Tax=Cephalotus follicularis TaxID=3775 RepID=A0A1Q3D9T6_CEPFO|nr:hypothetical protein CFOL_v3_32493 [Cephalotus follicularis]
MKMHSNHSLSFGRPCGRWRRRISVPAAQVHDWILQNKTVALEHPTVTVTTKENGPPSAPDQDVAMTDAFTSSVKASIIARGPSFIEGNSKSHAFCFKWNLNSDCFLVNRFIYFLSCFNMVFL